MDIKNLAKGPRTVEERVGKDGTRTLVIAPGETKKNVNLVNPDDPVFKAMVDNRELQVNDEGSDEDRELRELTEREEKLSAELDEIRRRKGELDESLNSLRVKRDPTLRDNRAAAMIAGNTPGLADPLPKGTDTKGGDESKRALEEMGHGDAHGTDATSKEELSKGGPDRRGGTSATPSREKIEARDSKAPRKGKGSDKGE